MYTHTHIIRYILIMIAMFVCYNAYMLYNLNNK